MVRPSKTQEWAPEQKRFNFPQYHENRIFTCEIDQLGRPSAIPGAKKGQKCITILLDD